MELHGDAHFAFLSSKGTQAHYDIDYQDNMFLVFGKESVGLPDDLLERHADRLYQIPLFSPHIRSLNLANAVGIIVYDGLRHLRQIKG